LAVEENATVSTANRQLPTANRDPPTNHLYSRRVSAGPRVTILMPVYNGQRYVDEAIASVVGQDYDDFEFVIVDDGSTDATPRLLAQWAARDSRIVVHRSPQNEGIPAALNRGLALARGEYVARQDADDLCLAGRLAKQVEVLDADPSVVLVSAAYEVFDSKGRSRGIHSRVRAPAVIEYLLQFSNAVAGHGQVMFRRGLVLALGSYSTEFRLSADYELWSRLVQHGRIVILPIVGMRHRLHDDRVSITSGTQQMSNSLRISRRNLTAFLGRELTDDEYASMASVWRQTDRLGSSAAAHRVFAEAYERFKSTDENRGHRRHARIATARAWFLSAAMHAKRGNVLEAIPQLGYSLRWHPLGFLNGAFAIAVRAVRFTLRSVQIASEKPDPVRLNLG
jgi:glycosyltransferase involved in cell wall biosynthesis